MLHRIPSVAVEWIAKIFEKEWKREVETKKRQLHQQGLVVLKVRELKQVFELVQKTKTYDALNRFENHPLPIKPTAHANKAARCKCLQQCFYEDENCETSNAILLEELEELIRHGRFQPDHPLSQQQQQATPSTPGTTATSIPAPRNSNYGQHHYMQHSMASMSSSSPSSPFPFPTNSHQPQHPNFVRAGWQIGGTNGSPATSAPSLSTSTSSSPAVGHASATNVKMKKSTQQNVKIKREPIPFHYPHSSSTGVEPTPTSQTNHEHQTSSSSTKESNPTLPQNAHEERLVTELGYMGFSDMREIMSGIRHFHPTTTTDKTLTDKPMDTSTTTADQVMMWIVTQREEMEEARKMDLVRLQSELDKKRQQEMQAKRAAERVKAATLAELSSNEFFPNSWILTLVSTNHMEPWLATTTTTTSGNSKCKDRCTSNNSNSDSTVLAHDEKSPPISKIKEILIQLLQVEQKAQKWYGLQLPRPFFRKLCKRLSAVFDPLPANNKGNRTLTDEKRASIEEKLKQEYNDLEEALFALSNQQGGVPILFLAEHEDAKSRKRKRRKNSDSNDTSSTNHDLDQTSDDDATDEDHDDDEIEVVGCRTASPPPLSDDDEKKDSKHMNGTTQKECRQPTALQKLRMEEKLPTEPSPSDVIDIQDE